MISRENNTKGGQKSPWNWVVGDVYVCVWERERECVWVRVSECERAAQDGRPGGSSGNASRCILNNNTTIPELIHYILRSPTALLSSFSIQRIILSLRPHYRTSRPIGTDSGSAFIPTIASSHKNDRYLNRPPRTIHASLSRCQPLHTFQLKLTTIVSGGKVQQNHI